MTDSAVPRVLVFGNSGAGKSTLAQKLRDQEGLAHLDLDTLAWQNTSPPQRRSIEESGEELDAYIRAHDGWVIEGCYADLLGLATRVATKMIWLNPATEICVAHARRRPWEPHKYESKDAQDANLPMLIDWIRAYETRDDEFSRVAHARLFDQFAGPKEMLTRPAAYAP